MSNFKGTNDRATGCPQDAHTYLSEPHAVVSSSLLLTEGHHVELVGRVLLLQGLHELVSDHPTSIGQTYYYTDSF